MGIGRLDDDVFILVRISVEIYDFWRKLGGHPGVHLVAGVSQLLCSLFIGSKR